MRGALNAAPATGVDAGIAPFRPRNQMPARVNLGWI